MKKTLIKIFKSLNEAIESENKKRLSESRKPLAKSTVEILGQTSLLLQPELTVKLSLVQTGDVDAFIKMEHFVKDKMKALLQQNGLIYDEDSYLIFIPKGSQFFPFMDLSLIEVKIIDPESALVSKAVKAPEKNKPLIRQAIASGEFSRLVDRIIENGGNLENFV